MSTPPTITITRCGGVAAHWVQVIERCERGEARTLKSDGGASVLALPGESGSTGLIIKRWELRTLETRLKSTVHASRAWRHWQGTQRLAKAGVGTAACYAIARSRNAATGSQVEWLITGRVPGKTLLQHMADHDLTVEQEHALARTVGHTVGTLVANGIHNRDGKPSNWIVVPPVTEQRAEIALIDTVAIRRTLPGIPSSRGWIWMLSALVIEPTGCGCPPRLALRARGLKSFVDTCPVMHKAAPAARKAMRRKLWHAVSKAITAHGDPTPRVNPLATQAPTGSSEPSASKAISPAAAARASDQTA